MSDIKEYVQRLKDDIRYEAWKSRAIRREIILSLVVFFLGIVLIVILLAQNTTWDRGASDAANQQLYINAINEENAVLREVNNNLRSQLIQVNENLSRTQATLAGCLKRCQDQNVSVASPAVHVPISDILVRQDQVILNIHDVQPGLVGTSRSMDPLLRENDVVLEVTPSSPSEIHAGDIIVYRLGKERVVHRVVRIDHDEKGWYAITKGDNNPAEDEENVRFSQVLGIVVGIIY